MSEKCKFSLFRLHVTTAFRIAPPNASLVAYLQRVAG